MHPLIGNYIGVCLFIVGIWLIVYMVCRDEVDKAIVTAGAKVLGWIANAAFTLYILNHFLIKYW